MKILLAYYSYSGNTEKVANILLKLLQLSNDVTLVKLQPKKEASGFLGQCASAFARRRVKLSNEKIDITQFDALVIGTPVWAFAPTPAINTFLDQARKLSGKQVAIFTTYGSGAGVGRCVDSIIKRVRGNGACGVSNFNIQQKSIEDKDLIYELAEASFKKIGIGA